MQGNEIKQKYDQIYHQIILAHRSYFFRKIGANSIRFFLISLAVIAIFVVINLLFDISTPLRLAFASGFILWFAGFTVIKIIPLLREIFSPSGSEIFNTASRLGQADASVRDALINYVQIYQNRASGNSPIIKNLALEQLYHRFANLSFRQKFDSNRFGRQARALAAVMVLFLIIYLIFPAPMGTVFKKILLPWENFREPLPIRLINESGNLTVLKNNSVTLRGSYEGVKPGRLFLVVEDTTGKEKPEKENLRDKIALSFPATGDFQYQFRSVRNPFKYYFMAEIDQPRFRKRPAVSEKGTIFIKERPLVRNLQIKITPPQYTGLPAQLLLQNDGEITALKGSRIDLLAEADKQLSAAGIQFSDSTRIPLTVAGHTARGQFTIKKNVSYTIHIFDTDSADNGQPVEYSIYPLADEYPFAEIRQPGGDVDLGDELRLPLFVEMRDDFGFHSLTLQGRLIRQGSTGDTSEFSMKLPYKVIEKGKAFSEQNWDLTSFYMIPDDYIQYYVEIMDNDRISGPKSYKTQVFTIRLPSLLDMMNQTARKQDDQLDKVKDMAGNTKELKKKLEDINRELKKETDINWERKQEIKEQLEKQKKSMEKLSEIQKDLEDVVQKLDQSKMLSPETLEKYAELQKMFQELASPELKDAMEKLQQALEKADPQQIQKAVERLQFSVEQFEKDIARTYELFQRVKLEQKMDELVNLAEKISQEQEEINKKLGAENKKPEELNQLGNKEENIREETDYLDKKISETNEEYQKLMQELSEKLNEAKSFMQDKNLQNSMQQMQQQLMNSQQQQASQSGEQIKANMEMLQAMLQSARQNMTDRQKQEIADAMQKAMQDMLQTSFKQEDLADRSQDLNPASSQINNIARQQASLQQSMHQLTGQLVDISNKTFFMSPQMSKFLQSIVSNMNKSIENLENRNPSQAANSQKQSMAGLNQALMSLQNSMKQMGQSSSASGFQEFMQQLQQMAGQQGQLNEQSLGLFKKGQQGRLQLSQDDMGRLAAQQEAIRQSMEQLSNQTQNRRDILGRLGELGGEMEKVIKDLKQQKLDREVIQRQEKILSRLLDAQKSIREKEYSKKREAEHEKQMLTKSPPELRRDLLQKEDKLRKELLEALQEGYSPEYRRLIKLYFETLSRQTESEPQSGE